eukprot:1308204-Amphidinium_carterae.1
MLPYSGLIAAIYNTFVRHKAPHEHRERLQRDFHSEDCAVSTGRIKYREAKVEIYVKFWGVELLFFWMRTAKSQDKTNPGTVRPPE